MTINLTRGRPQEKLEHMADAVAKAIHESIGAPLETVRVMINQMEDHEYSIGGRPFHEIRAERAKEIRS